MVLKEAWPLQGLEGKQSSHLRICKGRRNYPIEHLLYTNLSAVHFTRFVTLTDHSIPWRKRSSGGTEFQELWVLYLPGSRKLLS